MYKWHLTSVQKPSVTLYGRNSLAPVRNACPVCESIYGLMPLLFQKDIVPKLESINMFTKIFSQFVGNLFTWIAMNIVLHSETSTSNEHKEVYFSNQSYLLH